MASVSKGYSNKQWDVLELVLAGKNSKEISDILDLTEKGVKFHKTNIYKMTETNSITQLFAKALLLGVNPKSRESAEKLLPREFEEGILPGGLT